MSHSFITDAFLKNNFELLDYIVLVLAVLSVLRFSVTLYGIFVKGIYRHFLRPAINIRSKYGSWVVITGATDGIGKAVDYILLTKSNIY
jgi:17beta-estradiol 17-dehydrogenase / very-long-chain 3-oxoacyl-CoA reductase